MEKLIRVHVRQLGRWEYVLRYSNLSPFITVALFTARPSAFLKVHCYGKICSNIVLTNVLLLLSYSFCSLNRFGSSRFALCDLQIHLLLLYMIRYMIQKCLLVEQTLVVVTTKFSLGCFSFQLVNWTVWSINIYKTGYVKLREEQLKRTEQICS